MIFATARDRFESTRRAVHRLDDVHALIMTGGDDWRPEVTRPSGTVSDPTAASALRNITVLADKLDYLHEEERELTSLIGESLALIRAVREGLGDNYADVLEARYIDCWQWERVRDDYGIPKSTGHHLLNVAFDWLDSIGIARALRGEYDL